MSTSTDKTINWYDQHAAAAAARYEAVNAEAIHADLLPVVEGRIGVALDVGAGSGRDAGWLAGRGWEVVAVEPADQLRDKARALHPSPRISWVDDRLPGLTRTMRLGLGFDLIVLSAVWMHVSETDRRRAFRKLVTLLKPGGAIAISLRRGPADPDRGMHPVSTAEIERLARDHGGFVEARADNPDLSGRPEIGWTDLLVRLPDDGTGALPLLRHVILNDSKSSTYKLGLLRVLCRIGDGAAGMARDLDDDRVVLPLGLVALYWVRLFKPLLVADLPQTPSNIGLQGLGFAGPGFRQLMEIAGLDLRAGLRHAGPIARAIDSGLREAARTILMMPAHYMTYPDGRPILTGSRGHGRALKDHLVLDEPYLASLGDLVVPRDLWRAVQRFDAWIEPALVAEWTRLIKSYLAGQGRTVEDGVIATAIGWAEPTRDVRIARATALHLLRSPGGLRCIWSGARLTDCSLAVDHCLPWAVWPCDGLWNLLPVSSRVNLAKRDRLPTEQLLRAARGLILDWWDRGFRLTRNPVLRRQFVVDARTALPGLGSGRDEPALDEVFDGLNLQRLRLKQDQQVPEWDGPRALACGSEAGRVPRSTD